MGKGEGGPEGWDVNSSKILAISVKDFKTILIGVDAFVSSVS